MRIGFDVRPFLKEETGIGIYFKNLLFHLAQIDQFNEYYLFSSSFKDRFPVQRIPSFAKKQFRDFRFPVKIMNFLWYKLSWPHLDSFFRTELDLTHSPTPLILPTKGKKITTVYDLFFMDFPQMTDRETKRFFYRKTKRALLEADGIVTISQFTKNQMISKFSVEERKIRVIHPGVNYNFWSHMDSDELEEMRLKYNLPFSFILFVGSYEPRKNLLNLVEALKIIHEKYQEIYLILVGRKGQDYQNVKERIGYSSLESWVKMVGYLPERELRSLYQLASVFVFPSFHEGFGIPLLEAMASGLPIAASHAPAIPEIAQEAALYFDPSIPEDMAEKIMTALEDDHLRQNLIDKGKKRVLHFSWQRTSEQTLEFYHHIVREMS